MRYVDGYVVPVPKKHLPAYRRLAQKGGRIWRSTAPSSSGSASVTTSR